MLRLLALSLFGLALAGCASKDHVLFVTKTSIGVDFDTKPATASLAYDRVEGYLAPRYANGEIPPVIASVKSDGKVFNPEVKQVYATGEAAVIATGGRPRGQSRPLKGDREMMFFGTTTTTGIKLGFTTGLPDSFVFGFKRKEYSHIPLASGAGSGKEPHDVYASVLASIDTAANVDAEGRKTETSLTNAQFFATGAAARNLAATPQIRASFQSLAAESLRRQQAAKVEEAQKAADSIGTLLGDITAGFSDDETTAAQKQAIVDAAQGAGMDPSNGMTVANFEKRLTAYSSTAPAAEAQKKLQTLRDQVNALLMR
jgi:hypothetical protein